MEHEGIENEPNTIIKLLKKDYSLKTENILKQKIGEIVQDFIGRGLFNSTPCVVKQLNAHFEHINKLVDYIINSIEQDFANMPLDKAEKILLAIVNEEYKRLTPFANSCLVNAGLSQQTILESFKQLINRKEKETKQAIETRLAILEAKKATSKDNKGTTKTEPIDIETKKEQKEFRPSEMPKLLKMIYWFLDFKNWKNHWRVILLAGLLLLIFSGILVWPKFDLFGGSYHSTKKEVLKEAKKEVSKEALDDYGRTAIYARTQKRIDDLYKNIENEKLSPWLFINAGVRVQITEYNGKVISYEGVTFEGSPRIIFWSDDFIPPFIEDAIIKVFDQTIDECRKNNLAPKPYIDEANSLLNGFIGKIYYRMAEIDRGLRSKDYPKNAPRKDVSDEIEKMRKRLKGQYDAAVLLASKNGITD